MSVENLIKEIQERRTQKSVNVKDERLVCKELLNDRTFKAAVYGKDGIEDYVCPAEEIDSMVSGIISKTTGIGSQEAAKLAEEYEYTNQDADHMITFSKEFVNVYMDTGRKLSLGKRENADISLVQKIVPASVKSVPKKVGINEDGSAIIQFVDKDIKEHKSIKVINK